MKNLKVSLIAVTLLIFVSSCKKDDPTEIDVRNHTTTVNWYRDASTANPTCFLDLYNGKSYTMAVAATRPDSVDLFIYDRSQLIVSSQAIALINAVFFSSNNYAAYEPFNMDVGVLPLSVSNASTVSEVAITTSEFNDIRFNSDIDKLFSSKALNGGYTDIDIAATDLNATTKYYQFYCEGVNKRGFFHVVSNNYLPGGTMTLEIKVQE